MQASRRFQNSTMSQVPSIAHVARADHRFGGAGARRVIARIAAAPAFAFTYWYVYSGTSGRAARA
jgi:hypothetical protein